MADSWSPGIGRMAMRTASGSTSPIEGSNCLARDRDDDRAGSRHRQGATVGGIGIGVAAFRTGELRPGGATSSPVWCGALYRPSAKRRPAHADGNMEPRVRDLFTRLLMSGQYVRLIQPTPFVAAE